MKVLVLTAFYPIPGVTHERMFVHVRNQYYRKCGIDVTVLNFDAESEYELDGIPVIPLHKYADSGSKEEYDVLICHSANVRNHYRFLKKYEKRFPRLVFFFHGHEMLYLNKDYPKPYPYLSASKWHRQLIQNTYDTVKIRLWASYYKKLAAKSEFVFVSEWVHRHFLQNTHLCDRDLCDRVQVIHNSIGSAFESADYDLDAQKKYDFITIRANLDGSKYCIDLMTKYAEANPDKAFLLIGKGRFFAHNSLPENVDWISSTIDHASMLDYLNQSRCALMLTREDTQGVMTCEMETYGIPVITSDIEVCREFFSGRRNVRLISNTKAGNINEISASLCAALPFEKDTRFFAANTIQKEVDLLDRLIKGK